MAWRQIGSAAGSIVVGRPGVFATNPVSGDIYRYTGEDTRWEKIGGPGAMFAVSGSSLYGLAPNQTAVMRWTGTGEQWEKVGDAASSIVGGGAGLLATHPITGNVFRYRRDADTWDAIGGPGAMFAVGGEVFGLTPDRRAVMRWVRGTEWERIGNAADKIIAGTGGVYATQPGTGDVWRWGGRPDSWSRIGGPGSAFAAGSTIFGISPDRQNVMQWLGNDVWERVGGPAAAIAVWHNESEDHLYAIGPDRTVWYERLGTLS